MVSTGSGNAINDYSQNASKTTGTQRSPASKKRKSDAQETQQHPVNKKSKNEAQEPPPTEENKENVDPPSTPPPVESKVDQRETTPGRVGPIKCLPSPANPDIKPFKGPPGKKVRKTWYEKEQEYKQFIRENEGHPFHELYVCFDKGPNGSPTYDKSGFELDYYKVADWMKPKGYNKRAMVNGMERALEKRKRDEKRMGEIFFVKGEAPENPSCDAVDHWKDRVSKDLNVPWHRIGVEYFEEWEKRGFRKARRGEYAIFSEEQRKRMGKMHEGCALRK